MTDNMAKMNEYISSTTFQAILPLDILSISSSWIFRAKITVAAAEICNNIHWTEEKLTFWQVYGVGFQNLRCTYKERKYQSEPKNSIFTWSCTSNAHSYDNGIKLKICLIFQKASDVIYRLERLEEMGKFQEYIVFILENITQGLHDRFDWGSRVERERVLSIISVYGETILSGASKGHDWSVVVLKYCRYWEIGTIGMVIWNTQNYRLKIIASGRIAHKWKSHSKEIAEKKMKKKLIRGRMVSVT